MAPIPEVFPFAQLDSSWRYPAWIRGLRKANGVYIFRERDTDEIVYVGESHSDRLYATLTRHFQRWTNKYDTAGMTYGHAQQVLIALRKLHFKEIGQFHYVVASLSERW